MTVVFWVVVGCGVLTFILHVAGTAVDLRRPHDLEEG